MKKFILSIQNPKIFKPKFSGGKGANLARLLKYGFNVPPFFVISSSFYKYVITINGIDQLIETAIPAKSASSFNKIQSAILAAEIPEFIITQINGTFQNLIQQSTFKTVAVRSSALAEDRRERSFAGQLESYLDIQDEKQLLEAIRKCWASLWNDRVYCYFSKIQERFVPQSMAVIVQQMIPATYAGICFTIDPTDVAQDRMMIEAHEGIGAAIASGNIDPSRYRVHRKNLTIQGEGAIFNEPKLVDLAGTGLKIEKCFDAPQDIEWAIFNDKIYILQSRPITTMAKKPVAPSEKSWSNYFFGERFPQPVSPLGWSILKPLIEKNAFREPLQFLGFNDFARSRITRCFSGRPYTRLEVFKRLHSLFPTAYVSFDKKKLFYDRPVSLRDSLVKILKNFLRIVASILSTTDWIPPFHLRNWKRFLAYYFDQIKLLNRMSLSSASEPELWQMNFQAELLSDRLLSLHRWSITFAELFYHFLIALIRQWLPEAAADRIVAELHRGLPGNKTVEMNIELWKLSLTTSPDWEAFVQKFGHRSTSLDIAVPTFAEDVDYIRRLIQPYRSQPADLSPEMRQQKFERQRTIQRQSILKNLSQQPGGFGKKQFFKMLLNWSEQFFLLRENQRHCWHQALAINRKLFLELGRRWVERGWLEYEDQIFFLTWHEIGQAIFGQGLVSKIKIEKRIEQHRGWQGIQPPAIIDESAPFQLEAKPADRTLVGIGASPGLVTGRARSITALAEVTRVQPGEILVVPTTDPGWTPLFGIVKGLVMEVGGVLSHGAIVAREFGIPAVTSVAQATSRLVTGKTITVDGNKGMVWIHDE